MVILGCGGRTLDEAAFESTARDAGVEAAFDAAPPVWPWADERVDALMTKCRGRTNVISLEGYFNATVVDDNPDLGVRSRYVRVTTRVEPYTNVELSSDGLGKDLAVALYTDAAHWGAPGKAGISVSHRSTIITGSGWFRILELEWLDAAKTKLVRYTAVFEQWTPDFVKPPRSVFGCVHYERR